MRTILVVLALALLLPAVGLAQIPLPGASGVPTPPVRDPVKRLERELRTLKAQLAAIRELRSWAETSRKELWKIYSDSLANLAQARAAIAHAKGKKLAPYKQPSTFEVQTIRVGTSKKYPTTGSSTVAVMPPDDFYLHFKVSFPDQWVRANKRLKVSCQIYPSTYVPMASRYQNTTKAIYRVATSHLKVNKRDTSLNVKINGLGLTPGRYFTSCRVADKSYPPKVLISLGMFRVKGKLPPAVRRNLPHYTDWYDKYNKVVTLDWVDAKVRGKAIQLSGSYTRKDFKRGLEPVWVVAVAERLRDRTVVFRRKHRVTRGAMRFGGRKFLIKNHGLAPGTYKLKVGLFTEYTRGKYAWLRGSRSEKTVNVTIN